MRSVWHRSVLLALLCAVLISSGCGTLNPTDGPPSRPLKGSVADAVPKLEKLSKYGNPHSYAVNGKRYYTLKSSAGYAEKGVASWYGTKFHGRRTSSGEAYDMNAMTAAHRSLPLPTYVEVRNLRNDRKVIVKVNDRGPFHENRLIDLSYMAAVKLGIVATGTGLVEVRAIDPRAWRDGRAAAASDALNSRGDNRVGQSAAAAAILYVQVGAFTRYDNAERLKNRLANILFHPVQISPLREAEQTYYRVRIGPVESVAETDRLVDRLKQIEVYNASVVVDAT
ncbi:MAG: septal ring lytic transglycosylase RlpA family protein [Gammaproteobacteria bacterium]|nr:septal ring lytic transglycosylase RlpA family protein [Gammaproteobacteria bacterium]